MVTLTVAVAPAAVPRIAQDLARAEAVIFDTFGHLCHLCAAFGDRDCAVRVKNRSTRQCHVKRLQPKSLRAMMFCDGIILKTMRVGAKKHRKVALIGRLRIVSHCLYGRSETRAPEIVPDSAKKCHFSARVRNGPGITSLIELMLAAEREEDRSHAGWSMGTRAFRSLGVPSQNRDVISVPFVRFVSSARKRPLRVTSKKVLARKWRRHFSCSRAPKKSADIKAAKSMACVQKPRLQARKNGAFAPRKTAISAIFSSPIPAPAGLGPGLRAASGAKEKRGGPCCCAMNEFRPTKRSHRTLSGANETKPADQTTPNSRINHSGVIKQILSRKLRLR